MNKKILLLVLILVAGFLTLFRLSDTQLLIHDTARDTLKILTLWQSKSLTLIGPPASFSLNSIKEFYFGSFSYYLALLGMILLKFNPVGAVIPTIILYLLSIPIFYLFLRNISSNKFVIFIGTIIYSISPLNITHMRFFWNPNTIIPLSVFFWYLVTLRQKKEKFSVNFLAGIITAIIFNFHYFTVIPMAIWTLIVLFNKKWIKFLGIIAGFTIGTIPLFIFEIKHNFYILNALIYNLNNNVSLNNIDLFRIVGRLGEIFMAILGIKSGEIYYGTLFKFNGILYWLIEILFLILIIVVAYKIRKKNRFIYLFPSVISIIFAVIFSDTSFYTRYVFGALPLIIWLISEMFALKYSKFLLIPILVLITFANYKILSFTPNIKTGNIQIKTIEKISQKIVSENPQGRYNLSANINGDAQALDLRFFVQRDAKTKPQDIKNYNNLDRLYVVSPNIEKIKSENRWEYYASGDWNNVSVYDFGEINLYKFEKSY